MKSTRKLLVGETETRSMLSISGEDLEWLVNTEQLSPILLRGRRLFDVSQLNELVRTYQIVQSRGVKDEQDDAQ